MLSKEEDQLVENEPTVIAASLELPNNTIFNKSDKYDSNIAVTFNHKDSLYFEVKISFGEQTKKVFYLKSLLLKKSTRT